MELPHISFEITCHCIGDTVDISTIVVGLDTDFIESLSDIKIRKLQQQMQTVMEEGSFCQIIGRVDMGCFGDSHSLSITMRNNDKRFAISLDDLIKIKTAIWHFIL